MKEKFHITLKSTIDSNKYYEGWILKINDRCFRHFPKDHWEYWGVIKVVESFVNKCEKEFGVNDILYEDLTHLPYNVQHQKIYGRY